MDFRAFYFSRSSGGVTEDSFLMPYDGELAYIDFSVCAAATPAAAESANFRVDCYRGSFPADISANLVAGVTAQTSSVTAVGTSQVPMNKFCPVHVKATKGTKFGYRVSQAGNGVIAGYVTFGIIGKGS